MKKKKATIPKTTGWCPLLWYFLPGNNIRPESKEIIIIMIIIIITIIIIDKTDYLKIIKGSFIGN